MRSLKETLADGGLRLAFHYLDGDFEENMPKFLGLLLKLDRTGRWAEQEQIARAALADPDSEESKLLKAVWTELRPETRKELFKYAILHRKKCKK